MSDPATTSDPNDPADQKSGITDRHPVATGRLKATGRLVGRGGKAGLRGSKAGLEKAAEPRSKKPPNYKMHVLVALSLSALIRITRYGPSALTGKL